MIIELAQYEGVEGLINITEPELADLLFCEKPNHFVGIALVAEQLVGLVMFNYTHHNICVNVTHGVYIENLYVSPKFRKQGIGSALLKYVAEKAKINNCSRIEWWVSREDPVASHFYQKIGAIALSDWAVFKCDRVGIDKLVGMRIE